MFYLSAEDIERWRGLTAAAMRGDDLDPSVLESVSLSLRPALCYHLGTRLLSEGLKADARRWLEQGAGIEQVRACAYLLDYLERNEGELKAVEPSFSDPRPWTHFSSLPHLRSAREALIDFYGRSLPGFTRPLHVMDIGCGNGRLVAAVLERLIETSKAPGVAEVLLLDPFPRMLDEAGSHVAEAFPGADVTTLEGGLETFSSGLPRGFDLALCALSVHHMPYEAKEVHIGTLSRAVRHLVIFELDANHDTPEVGSPELSCSVYQTFGQSLEYVFAQAAPLEVQRACADIFVMSETVSLLSEPRGERTEYHMLRSQWHRLLENVCPPDVSCLGEMTCYSDEHCELFALHYGR